MYFLYFSEQPKSYRLEKTFSDVVEAANYVKNLKEKGVLSCRWKLTDLNPYESRHKSNVGGKDK